MPTVGKNPSAHALNVCEQIFLIDCAEGTQQQLKRAGISLLKINHIFITHLHGDHIYGIWGVISTMGLLDRRIPLHIYAPNPFGELLEHHLKYFDNNLPYQIIWHEVDTRKHQMIFDNKVMEVWSIPLRHKVPCAGFHFKEKMPELNVDKQAISRYNLSLAQIVAAKRGQDITLDDGTIIENNRLTYIPYSPRSYAYLSDTLYSAKAASLIEGVDLLYHEATYMHEDRLRAKTTGHSTTVQAARVAQLSGAKQLIIGHFSSRYKELTPLLEQTREHFPQTILAHEGDTVTIPLKRLTRE